MDSRRRFRQNEAAKLDPIIFRDGRGAKRNDEDGFSQGSNREAYFITLNVAKDDGNGMANNEYTRGVYALPGHSNSHLLQFSTVDWSGISRSHEGTRTTDEGLLEICQSAESGSAAQHIFLEEDEDATRGEYKELIWLPVCGAVVDDPNLRKEGAESSSSRIIPGTLFCSEYLKSYSSRPDSMCSLSSVSCTKQYHTPMAGHHVRGERPDFPR